MKRLLCSLRKYIKEHRFAAQITVASVCCISVVSVLLIFMPRGYAEGAGTQNDPYILTDAVSGGASLSTGTYYEIPAGNYTSGIEFTIQNSTSSMAQQDVYLILDNVRFTLNSDEPALSFKCSYTEKSVKNGNEAAISDTMKKMNNVKIHLILKGESQITGTYNEAVSPLIQAENFRYVTEEYDSNSVGVPGSEGKYTCHAQNLSLSIEKYNNDVRHSLTLVTARNSYGAAIGSSETSETLRNIGIAGIESSQDKTSAKNHFKGQEHIFQGMGNNYFCYEVGTYLRDMGDATFTYGAAAVTVESGVLNISGNGYGAGIGNGGSKSIAKPFGDGSTETMYGKTIEVSAVQNTGSVHINNGTVAVVMSPSSKGACFINGAYNSVADDGPVMIDGGSLYIKRQCDYVTPVPYEKAYNSSGAPLYLYEANYQTDISGDAEQKYVYNLDNVFDTEKDYAYSVNKDTYTPNDGSDIEYLEAAVQIDSTQTYSFDGYHHTKEYSDGEAATSGKLYFYLPANRLERYSFTIKDDYNNRFDYSISISDGKISGTADTLSKWSYTPYLKPVEVLETKCVVAKVENVPEYCNGITARIEQTGDECVVEKGTDGIYYVYMTKIVASDVTMVFDYDMGSFNIRYDYGLLDTDKNEAGNIVNGNPASYECGAVLTLGTDNVTWTGRRFAGWYEDEELTKPVTELTSTVVGDTKTVYAKWMCSIVYDTEEGSLPSSFANTYNVVYGDSFDILRPDGSSIPDINLGEDTGLIELTGWQCGNTLYTEGMSEPSVLTVSRDMSVTAKFKRAGYYVYVTATVGNSDEYVDIKDYIKPDTFKMIYENKQPQELQDNAGKDKYYRTVGFVSKEYATTVSMTPKDGYEVRGKSMTGGNMIADNGSQFTFRMDEQDIYIIIHFYEKVYNIKYFDEADGSFSEIEAAPNPETYTVSTESFKFAEPDNAREKYWKFAGFKIFGTEKVIDGINKGEMTEDLMLVAQWDEIPVYDIIIDDADIGDIKSYVDGKETSQAAAGEKITLTAAAATGIRLTQVEYSWFDENGIKTSHTLPCDITGDTVELSFVMPSADVEVEGMFEAIKYYITYLNLNGAVNDNPFTYTVFDEIELSQPQKDGWTFGKWQLITPDASTEDENDVKREDIVKIEKGTHGNLMLYAEWENAGDTGEGRLYHVTTDDAVTNGSLGLYKTEAKCGEFVLVKVEEKDGYRLKEMSYSMVPCAERYMSTFARLFAARNVAVDISVNQVADGVYYFVMPESDVELTAVFEPIPYSITYDAGGGQHGNVGTYTVENNLVLTDAVKEGYTFKGWYDENGSQVEDTRGHMGNLVLIAGWEKIPVSSGDDTNGGNTGDNTNGNTGDNTGGDNTNGGSGADTDAGGNGGASDNDGVSDNSNGSDVNGSGRPGTSDKTNSYISSGNIQTGDSANAARLIIICVICAAVLILLIVMKKKDKDGDNKE